MGLLSNKVSREDLKAGDHIYSWRNAYIYAHHGIYVGDGNVIHFTQGAGQEIGTGTLLDNFIVSSCPVHHIPCPQCGDLSGRDGVIITCLDCFLLGGDVNRFEYGVSTAFFLAKVRGGTCTRARSDPVQDVLHRANFLLQNGFRDYHVFTSNCEDFAFYCKTGVLVGRSGQAASLNAAASVFYSPLGGLIGGYSGVAVFCYGTYKYCQNRLVSDVGVGTDVEKVPVESLVAKED